MTRAICLQCGKPKIGAISPCSACGFVPRSPEDEAKSLALSDRHMSDEELNAASARLKNGDAVALDPDLIRSLTGPLAAAPRTPMPTGCAIAVWTPIVVLILLVLFLVGFFIFAKLHPPGT